MITYLGVSEHFAGSGVTSNIKITFTIYFTYLFTYLFTVLCRMRPVPATAKAIYCSLIFPYYKLHALL